MSSVSVLMPDPSTLFAFCMALLVMQATPGPDTILILARGIGEGRRIALCTVLGMTLLAGLIQLPLLVLGVASLLHASPLAFTLLRWTGAVYLLWLGLRLIVTSTHLRPAPAHATRTAAWPAMREGMINSLTNPNPLLFMFAFLPQFVDPAQSPVWLQLLLLGLLQKISGFFILGWIALASGAVGNWLAQRPRWFRWQERISGAVMIALGVRLLLSGDARPIRI
jgi:threonine/homoserine/homoserine lactone efflux protein